MTSDRLLESYFVKYIQDNIATIGLHLRKSDDDFKNDLLRYKIGVTQLMDNNGHVWQCEHFTTHNIFYMIEVVDH